MAEFDQYSDRYGAQLERSLGGLASIDLAVRSKLDLLAAILAETGVESPSRLLDFGCGTGLLSAHLDRFGAQIIGLDMSLDSLRRSAAPDTDRVAYDGSRIPLRRDSVDTIVASCVFHHIVPADRQGVLTELRRILAPDGLLIIIEHNLWNPVTRWVVNRCEFDADAVLLDRRETARLLETAGFERVAGRYFFTVPPANPALRAVDRLLGWSATGAQYCCYGQKPHRPRAA